MSLKKTSFVALVAASFVFAPVASSHFTGYDMAFAKGGNGGGNGGGNSGNHGGGNAGGKSASHGKPSSPGKSGAAHAATGGPVKFLNDLFSGGSKKSGNATTKVTAKPAKTRVRSTTPTDYAVAESPRPNGKPKLTKASFTKQGALASELKGLNAAHASPTALANAAPNSQVGRIATYKAAVLAAGALDQQLADAQQTLSELQSQVIRTPDAVQADIDALDPTAPDYQDQLAALQSELDASTAYQSELASAQQAVTDLEAQGGDYRSPSDIQADIDALDPTATDYQTQLAALQSELDGAQAYDQQLAQAQQSLSDLQSQTLRSPDAIQADLDALDATDPANADQIAALQAELEASQTYQTELASAQQSVSQLETEVSTATQDQQDALLSASNGRELSPEALAYLNELLGLPAPDATTQDATVEPVTATTEPAVTTDTGSSG